jgi:hypothetical protein
VTVGRTVGPTVLDACEISFAMVPATVERVRRPDGQRKGWDDAVAGSSAVTIHLTVWVTVGDEGAVDHQTLNGRRRLGIKTVGGRSGDGGRTVAGSVWRSSAMTIRRDGGGDCRGRVLLQPPSLHRLLNGLPNDPPRDRRESGRAPESVSVGL